MMNIKGNEERVRRERADIICSYIQDFDPSTHGIHYTYIWLHDKMWVMAHRISDDK